MSKDLSTVYVDAPLTLGSITRILETKYTEENVASLGEESIILGALAKSFRYNLVNFCLVSHS